MTPALSHHTPGAGPAKKKATPTRHHWRSAFGGRRTWAQLAQDFAGGGQGGLVVGKLEHRGKQRTGLEGPKARLEDADKFKAGIAKVARGLGTFGQGAAL